MDDNEVGESSKHMYAVRIATPHPNTQRSDDSKRSRIKDGTLSNGLQSVRRSNPWRHGGSGSYCGTVVRGRTSPPLTPESGLNHDHTQQIPPLTYPCTVPRRSNKSYHYLAIKIFNGVMPFQSYLSGSDCLVHACRTWLVTAFY